MVGDIFQQDWEYGWHRVAFYSQKLVTAQQNYHMTKREELAIVLAIKH